MDKDKEEDLDAINKHLDAIDKIKADTAAMLSLINRLEARLMLEKRDLMK